MAAVGRPVWNNLPSQLRQDINYRQFRWQLKTFLFGINWSRRFVAVCLRNTRTYCTYLLTYLLTYLTIASCLFPVHLERSWWQTRPRQRASLLKRLAQGRHLLKTADISDILVVVQSLTITVTVIFCNVSSDGKAIALPIRYGCFFCISHITVTGTQRGRKC